MSLRLILADDHALFRQGLRSMLRLQPDVEVVAEVERVADLGSVLAATPCDILLLDLQMDRNALAEIESLSARVRVLVVTASENAGDALAALRSGARAVVLKRFAIETLVDAIHAVRDGHVWVPPALQAELREQAFASPTSRLSSREIEIARLVALGLRNAEIAGRLAITEATVKAHLNKVFQKLELRDRVELARFAIRTGLARADEGPP